MELSYTKPDNTQLFKTLDEMLDLSQIQNYIPLYNCYFSLTSQNAKNINLNHHYYLQSLQELVTDNKCIGTLNQLSGSPLPQMPVFFKFSPLLDPIKYMIGKYNMTDPDLLKLPEFGTTNSHLKTQDVNNAAYIDSFFTYLTSQLLHQHEFIHGLDFYGSFLGLKKNYAANICDDIEYMYESDFFHANKGVLFTLDHSEELSRLDMRLDTRNKKQRLEFSSEELDIKDLICEIGADADGGGANGLLCGRVSPCIELPLVVFDQVALKSASGSSSSSTCSSRSSNTTGSPRSAGSSRSGETEDEDEDEEEDTETMESEEDSIIAWINTFPVQIIALECCENTLDSLIQEQPNLSDEEWDSIVLQILFSLITFQKTFGLTHNDLHTNNIMYNKTDKVYLYYKIDGKYYKVPTFGRIFKIIDFGRAIYKFKGNVHCSDSYHKEGDAATQYNCDPYMNTNKPRLDPNFSFDLCRLGCALFDLLVEENEQVESDMRNIKSPIMRIILRWCFDDKNRNILYKNNGDERYPEFKLYKMIARTVHNHVPLHVLQNPHFEQYQINKKKIKPGHKLMNIDEMPCYMV